MTSLQELREQKRAASGQRVSESQADDAASNGSANGHRRHESHMSTAVDADPYSLLLITADYLDDVERVRIATENRVRSLEQVKNIPTGLMTFWYEQVAATQHLETSATKQLERAMKKHPLNPWVESMVGVGHKQIARLLAATGDPAERETLGQFRQYCGHGDPARSSKRRGEQIEFNPEAKMRIYLIAAQCIKYAQSPYRPVYDAGREKYADALHPGPCLRCGPAGKPAQKGSELNDGHKHARAIRLVAKAILKDLYAAAKEVE